MGLWRQADLDAGVEGALNKRPLQWQKAREDPLPEQSTVFLQLTDLIRKDLRLHPLTSAYLVPQTPAKGVWNVPSALPCFFQDFLETQPGNRSLTIFPPLVPHPGYLLPGKAL